MSSHDRATLTEPRVIICEGRVDEAFLRALIAARGLPPFCIRNPEDFGARGISGIGESIAGLKIMPGFDQVTGILVVVDSDDDPNVNFASVREQIESLHDLTFVAPTSLIGRSTGNPSIEVVTVPWIDESGCLETLCYGVAAATNPGLAGCVATFSSCAAVDGWGNQRKKHKVWLQILLGSVREQNAAMTLGRVWIDNPTCLPLEHGAFDRLAAVLGTY